jgi:hypothetical protein
VAHIVFVDYHLDWSNFSVAGNLREMYGSPMPPVEMYDSCDLSKLDPADELYLSAHGSSTSSGSFKDAGDLAKALQGAGLKTSHKTLVLMTCSSADVPPNQTCFAVELKTAMDALGYKSINVWGGTGRVLVSNTGREALMADRFKGEAWGIQSGVMKNHQSQVDHCTLLVTKVMGTPPNNKKPSGAELAKAADEVNMTLKGFYKDLMTAFKPMLKADPGAFAKF